MVRFFIDTVFGSTLFGLVILFPIIVFIANLIW